MITLHIDCIDGERVYMIQSPEPKEVIKFVEIHAHEGDDFQLEVDGKDLEYPEIEKWFQENNK